MSSADKVQTVLKVSPKLRAAFKRLAEADGRTMAGEFTYLVLQEVQLRKRTREQ
jgi:hypothetical protein